MLIELVLDTECEELSELDADPLTLCTFDPNAAALILVCKEGDGIAVHEQMLVQVAFSVGVLTTESVTDFNALLVKPITDIDGDGDGVIKNIV